MKQDNYISLLYKKLNGEISSTEAEELSRWRASDKENEKEARSVELAWKLTAPKEDTPQADLDLEFGKLQDRISDTQMVSMPARTLGRYWLRIAAGIAILAIAGFLLRDFFVSSNEGELQWSTAETQTATRELLLADGSEIHLNTNSQLSFPLQFNTDERRVRLRGEAFFEIARDESKAFVVEVGGNEIKVLGTSFNVAEHPEEGKTMVYVNTGKVEVSTEEKTETVTLTIGQSIAIDHKTKTVTDKNQASANAMSWHTRRLVFKQTPIKEALQMVEEYTGLSFQIAQASLGNCLLDTSFNFDEPDRFIDDLSTIFNAQIEETEIGRYSITGGSCD